MFQCLYCVGDPPPGPLRGGGGCFNVCNVIETHPFVPCLQECIPNLNGKCAGPPAESVIDSPTAGRQALQEGGNLIQLELPLLGGGWGVGDDAGQIVLMQLDPVSNGSHYFTQVCFDILVFKPQKSNTK